MIAGFHNGSRFFVAFFSSSATLDGNDFHMNEHKLFFGIPLSGRLRKRLAQDAKEWEKYPIFLTRPDNLHVTVLFLGFVKPEAIADISEAAREACACVEPFDMLFSGIELAPESDDPKMIWLSGEPSEELRLLRTAFERAFSEKLAENKSFRPHVTLARIRRNLWNALPEESKPAFPIRVALSEPVSSVVLFESVSSGVNRQYLPMEEFPLGMTD
jgi:2'-5' RNA ligase